MQVIVTLDYRFDRTPEGRVWAQTIFPYSFWSRYLQVFDSVRVVARVRDVPNVPSDSKETNGERVSFAAIPITLALGNICLRHGKCGGVPEMQSTQTMR